MDNDFLPQLFICIEGIVPRQGSTSRFILLYFRQDCSRHAGRSPPSFSRSSLGSLSAIYRRLFTTASPLQSKREPFLEKGARRCFWPANLITPSVNSMPLSERRSKDELLCVLIPFGVNRGSSVLGCATSCKGNKHIVSS